MANDTAVLSGAPAAPASARRLSEDWTSVVVGLAVLAAVLAAFAWKFAGLGGIVTSFRWTTEQQIAASVPGWNAALETIGADARAAGDAKTAGLARGLQDAFSAGDRAGIAAAAGRLASLGGRTLAGALGSEVRGHAAADGPARVFAAENLTRVLWVGAGLLVFAVAGIALMGGRIVPFVLAFPAVFALAWLARVAAGNGLFVDWGIEYIVLSLALGLAISNFLGLPDWLRPAVQTEFFVKTGLVILGAGLLFDEILQAGALGIAQALLVVFVVWYACFWLCRRLGVDDEFAAMLSTAVSICGVSAAIAACGAIQGDKKKLSYVTSLVLVVAVPMIVAMPWIAKVTGMDETVAGAWLGGTLDTSASVVAAGALIGETAMKTGIIVKFSQNSLIGIAAFALAIWWALKDQKATGQRPSARVIWDRFPKFVIGFTAVSLVFSFLLDPAPVAGTKSVLGELRVWWFALAFVCIGLETRFVDLVSAGGGRPALAFVAAQTINVFWTLLISYLLFGGVFFPAPVL